MESKFSKGEWSLAHFAQENSNCVCGFVFSNESEECIATIHYKHNDSTEESEHPELETAIANAKLISATPELLEACQKALQVLESENIFGQARLLLAVAIKKAIG